MAIQTRGPISNHYAITANIIVLFNLLLGPSQKLPFAVNYIVKVYWELLDITI